VCLFLCVERGRTKLKEKTEIVPRKINTHTHTLTFTP